MHRCTERELQGKQSRAKAKSGRAGESLIQKAIRGRTFRIESESVSEHEAGLHRPVLFYFFLVGSTVQLAVERASELCGWTAKSVLAY